MAHLPPGSVLVISDNTKNNLDKNHTEVLCPCNKARCLVRPTQRKNHEWKLLSDCEILRELVKYEVQCLRKFMKS